MRISLIVLLGLFFVVGCAKVVPNIEVTQELNISKGIPKKKKKSIFFECNIRKLLALENTKVVEEEIDEVQILLNVFDDELYFEKDKVGVDKTKVVIKYLDAFPWEKKVLKKVYAKYKRLWSDTQSMTFRKILEEDKYLSLCSDRRYWENLAFEERQPERDILQSILLLRYLTNLTHGCPEWIVSNYKVKNENSKAHINTKQVFSLLPHGVLIEKLVSLYLPKEKKFALLLEKHKNSLEEAKKKEILKEERLEIEAFKCKKCQPNYKKKRK